MEKQYVAFAHYKNGKLLGYRADTFGSIRDRPKIYGYSPEQVEICLRWINSAMKQGGTKLGELLLEKTGNPIAALLVKGEKEIHEQLMDAETFEVRVVECPGYPWEKEFDVKKAEWVEKCTWNYPSAEIDEWIKTPETHKILETHTFSLFGQLNPQ
jgi:hypothetical protein